jgi:hypothetical protein
MDYNTVCQERKNPRAPPLKDEEEMKGDEAPLVFSIRIV